MNERGAHQAQVAFETLSELLQGVRREFAAREAFGFKKSTGRWKWISYRQFGALVDRAAAALADRGIERGDRVALLSNNRLEWVTCAFASYRLGAAIVPMYEQQRSSEWEYIVGDSGAKALFVAGQQRYRDLKPLADRLSQLRFVIGFDVPETQAPGSEDSYHRLLDRGARLLTEGHALPTDRARRDDLAAILYTSGTTGQPKGVRLSHGNFCSNVNGALQHFDFLPGDRSLAFLPWAHAFGQVCELYCMLGAGGTIAINDEVPQLLDNLKVVRPNVLVAVPRIFNRIYEKVHTQIAHKPRPVQALFEAALDACSRRRQGEPLTLLDRAALLAADRVIFSKVRQTFGGHLRFVVSGSAALSPAVAEFIDALGIEVYEGYGLTETSPVVSANGPRHCRLGTAGRPFPGVTISIDRTVTDDPAHGEILVRGPNVMLGYHGLDEETEAVLSDDGVFRTGDMGYVDEQGFLHITGRIKEQYKLETGKYIVPAPLEEELKLSPYIDSVMLYGHNQPYNVALVVVNLEAVRRWAEENGIQLPEEPERSEDLHALIMGQVQRHSETFRQYERPKKLLLIGEDFSAENGMLTPKMSVKRTTVLERYEQELLALYDTPRDQRAAC